jgi:para-nitrobenzyl esterase
MPGRALLGLLLAACLLGAGCDDEPEVVDVTLATTASGAVAGVRVDGIRSWKGVPYAAPPVGDLRWRPPEPVEPWDDVRDAADYGAACLQGRPTAMSEALVTVVTTSEDCLTLNVHRPDDETEGLPVMVFVHGGGFVYGSGSQPTFNSPELVRRGVVLVTLNYRLGRLGFLAHPALQDGDQRMANFGLLDQVAALTWVQDNIAAFGGDAGNVTVFGESAGGVSVNALMTSPAADGLFHRAISQSGLGREPSQRWDAALADGARTFEPLVGAEPSAADLRALDGKDVVELSPSILAGEAPVVDDVLPQRVAEAFEAGEQAEVPYLTGTTDVEWPDVYVRTIRDPDDWRSEMLGEHADEALAAYGSDDELDLHLISDVVFTEPARHLALEHADTAPSYRYLFGIAPQPVVDQLGGAPHTSELAFVFDDTARLGVDVPDADALADQVADLWVDFATDGEPDGWPLASTGELMAFTVAGREVHDDPWAARLDVVEAGYERLAAAAGAAS